MPALLVGRRFGIQKILPLTTEPCRGIKTLGISGSSRQQSAMSETERFFLTALQSNRGLGCTTAFLKLEDLTIHDGEGNYSEHPAYFTYPCRSALKYKDDEVQKVYDAVLGFHVSEVSIASWVDEDDENTTKDWEEIQQNRYIHEDRDNLLYGSLELAVSLKAPCEANANSKELKDQDESY